MRADGWHAEVEVKVTKLLRRGFGKDHGDVDVLAWRDNGRVLAIECKDVQFRKTLGEMAEQLSDFRGEIRSNGKRDELCKHLDRMEVIGQHPPLVAAYIGRRRLMRSRATSCSVTQCQWSLRSAAWRDRSRSAISARSRRFRPGAKRRGYHLVTSLINLKCCGSTRQRPVCREGRLILTLRSPRLDRGPIRP